MSSIILVRENYLDFFRLAMFLEQTTKIVIFSLSNTAFWLNEAKISCGIPFLTLDAFSLLNQNKFSLPIIGIL